MFTFPTWILATICSAFMVTPVAMTAFSKGEKGKKINKIASVVGFVLYAGLTALLTLTESSVDFYKTVINFTASSKWLSKVFSMSFYNNTFHTIENLAMLMPLGAMTMQNQKAKGKNFSILKGLGVGFLAGLSIESLQFILPVNREPDVFDIMMNTLSCGFGATTAVGAVTLKNKISSLLNKEKSNEQEKTLSKEKAYSFEYAQQQSNEKSPEIKYATNIKNAMKNNFEPVFQNGLELVKEVSCDNTYKTAQPQEHSTKKKNNSVNAIKPATNLNSKILDEDDETHQKKYKSVNKKLILAPYFKESKTLKVKNNNVANAFELLNSEKNNGQNQYGQMN